MARRNTKLESVAAEFLVLGQLLLERVEAYKSYTNMPGYDLVATNPHTNKSARIQVKSRARLGDSHMIVKNLDFDFLVGVRLNGTRKLGPDDNILAPQFFVLPVQAVAKARRKSRFGWVVRFREVSNEYRENWSQIAGFLADAGRLTVATP